MEYRRPTRSRREVDAAGRLLAVTAPGDADRERARQVVEEWRGVHGHPLRVIRGLLEDCARDTDPEVLIAERLKRIASVESKLRRFPRMKLSRMHDLGGCRAILGSSAAAESLVARLREVGDRHGLARVYDYIAEPKPTGYRSVHLVFRYRNADPDDVDWNGLRVEIQARSKHQHSWATAVETVDALAGTSIKTSGLANGDWDRFFSLMGSVLALEEERPPVPMTPAALPELREEVQDLVRRLNVWDILIGLGGRLHHAAFETDADWYLMMLDAGARKIDVTPWHNHQLEEAQARYLELEAEHEGRAGFQVCLVSTTSANDLREAYPNYFLEAGPFNAALARLVGPPSADALTL